MLHHVFEFFVIFHFQGHEELVVASNHSFSLFQFHLFYCECPICICTTKLIMMNHCPDIQRYSYNEIYFSKNFLNTIFLPVQFDTYFLIS